MGTEKKGIIEISADARLLIELMKGVGEGETLTYGEMSDCIERDVQNVARGQMYTAMRNMLASGIVFDTVRGVGVKRLTANEIAIGAGRKSITRIHREARRGLKKLRCAAGAELSNDETVKMNTDASILGVLSICTKQSKVKQLENTVKNKGNAELAIGQTLEAFKK